MDDLAIYKTIMDVFEDYTGLPCNNIQRYQAYPYPQRMSRLCGDLKEHVLRQKGDIKQYLTLQKQIFELGYTNESDQAIYLIMQWLDEQMDAIQPVTPERDIFVMSYLVFGKRYIKKLLEYNFKSLMAYHNMPCLAIEKQVIIYIQTDKRGMESIEAAAITLALKSQGVHFDYTIIPDEIVGLLNNPSINYWMLGAGGSLGIHYAKSLRAAFHHSYPDIIYSNKFFSEVLRLSKEHKAILGAGMRSQEDLLLLAITPYLTPKDLSIPAQDLIAHHLNCIHPVAWPFIVNNRPSYWLFPDNHIMIWESENLVHFNTPHVMGYWLDYSLLKDLPDRYYQTLDSEMDFICKGEDYYTIQETDECYQAELSPPDRQDMSDIFTDFQGAANTLWRCVSHRDTMKFFFREIRLKINREIRPVPLNLIYETHVESLQRTLYNTILSADPFRAINLKRPRTHKGYIFE